MLDLSDVRQHDGRKEQRGEIDQIGNAVNLDWALTLDWPQLAIHRQIMSQLEFQCQVKIRNFF
jgi:hypothetical protein